MRVRDLIALLNHENPDHEVVLCDPDTQRTLPLKWGDGYPTPQHSNPPNVVFVTADYADVETYNKRS